MYGRLYFKNTLLQFNNKLGGCKITLGAGFWYYNVWKRLKIAKRLP